METTTYATVRALPGAATPSWVEQVEGTAVRGERLRMPAPVMLQLPVLLLGAPRISPDLPVHGSGLSFAGSGVDATRLPPRGAPV